MRVEIPVSIVPASEGAVEVGVREKRAGVGGGPGSGGPGRGVRFGGGNGAGGRGLANPGDVLPVIRWLFYGFVFSLPFETVNSGFLEPPTLLGGLLLASTLLQPGVFLRWPPRAFWCFFVYLYFSVAIGPLEPAVYRAEVIGKLFLLFQLVLLSWIAFSLMRDERVAKTALLTLVVACGLLSVLQVSGVAAQATDVGAKAERVTAFGFHPNNLARILTLGLLAAVGLTYACARSVIKPRFLIWPLVVTIGVALVQTGSRGALLAVGCGLMIFVLSGHNLLTKLRNVVGVLVIMAFFVWAGFQSESTRIRFEKTLEEGDMARREQIYPAAWEMFQERPLLGWGTIASTYELGWRLGHIDEDTKNPHNLILYGLVSTGVLGAIPLFLGTGLAVWAAWKSRRGPHGVLPLTLITAVLVANMSGLWLFNKLHWLVMAYAVATMHYQLRTADFGLRIKKTRALVASTGRRAVPQATFSSIRSPQSAVRNSL
ncbi:MAG TPA: O-antigen ligase family protein [Pyrinomonadaceae bacterium]|nr:O-antigen ligase family protein [Pyrinomonadaceae bacterium]